MKRILCFGDSNTWGYNPATQQRFPKEKRWPLVMLHELGADYEVIEEGLNGRTTVWEDPIEEYKCGKDHLIPCIKTHQPLDLLIILLGTNDLKMRFSLSAFDIAQGAGTLVRLAATTGDDIGGPAPSVLLLAPPPTAKLSEFADMLEGAGKKSKKFGTNYAEVAEECGCHFLDTGKHIRSSDLDGVHLDEENQQKLGQIVAQTVKDIL
jgi:lysophospholipase L1-like esterase